MTLYKNSHGWNEHTAIYYCRLKGIQKPEGLYMENKL
jgi:hypothetical protein